VENISPHPDSIQYNHEKVLERCVTRGCQNYGIFEVRLKYIKKSAPVCEQCIIEYRQLGYIDKEQDMLEEEGS
jgi:hypothetical protein